MPAGLWGVGIFHGHVGAENMEENMEEKGFWRAPNRASLMPQQVKNLQAMQET